MVYAGMVGVASVAEGMTVGGRYRLVAVVGSGARGRVWRAYDELLDREVAVKEVRDRDTAREARAAPTVDDPGLVRVLGVVRTTGRSWVVMEYVPSRSLDDRVTRDGPLNHREAISVGLGMARALAAAHAAGVVHRGLEPRHVLIAGDGRVVLTDLGVAAPVDTGPSAAGGTQLMFGSRHYRAPELRAGGVATEATDLWSLGATLHTAVEGYPPLGGAPAVEPRNPGLLHAVIAGLLAADPRSRGTAVDTRAALQALAGRAIGVSAVRASGPAEEEEPPPALAVEPRPAPRRRRLRRAVLVAAAVSAAAAATAATPWVRTAATPWVRAHVNLARPAAASAAPLSTGPCAGAIPQPTSVAASAPIAVPANWVWHADQVGFALPVPAGWTRAALGGVVCFGDPGGGRVFSVGSELLNDDGPLLHWQAAEIAALADGSLPGYQRVSMQALPGGGADWEYTWQPATGPRLHTRRVLPTGASGAADGLTWTTPDLQWASGAGEQSTLLAGFRDPSNTPMAAG